MRSVIKDTHRELGLREEISCDDFLSSTEAKRGSSRAKGFVGASETISEEEVNV